MQFVFARRGRRVFQRLNLRQAAALSTRASPAVEPIRRVSCLSNARTATVVVKSTHSPITSLSNVNQWARCYATAAAEGTTSKTAAKKTGAAAKKSAKPKAKTAKKPKKKAVKPKEKLTEEQLAKKKAAQDKKKLKEELQRSKAESLAATEPKPPLSHTWPLFIKKRLHGFKGSVTTQLSTISAEFKNLSSSEREELSRELEQSNQESTRAYTEWVNSHTPLQIKNANTARRRLALLTADRANPIKLSQIKDERQVKHPRTPFIIFYKERISSGDLKHLSLMEMSAQARSEYNELSESEKEKYKQLAQQDSERYRRECKEVYGQES
ncbi:HMG box protein [Talaromyces islandicus]|uniref:HMG box protein n=1 Tax=Talaromyces islandicus TaxID=28573 RepID=A0A0U1LPG2_TALIS|nr:HMG box protein [Talaromyces islandicus]